MWHVKSFATAIPKSDWPNLEWLRRSGRNKAQSLFAATGDLEHKQSLNLIWICLNLRERKNELNIRNYDFI